MEMFDLRELIVYDEGEQLFVWSFYHTGDIETFRLREQILYAFED